MGMMYKLIKLSAPGFTLETNEIGHVYTVLDQFVCTSCTTLESELRDTLKKDYNEGKLTKEEYETEVWSIDNNYSGMPDNWKELDTHKLVDILLGTACGCEFYLEEENDEEERKEDIL